MRASTRSLPPAGGWKSVRVVSIRPEVQWPLASRTGVMRRLPLPSSATLPVLFVIVSTSPVPQLAGPPGYEVPVSYCQLEVETPVPAEPLKSSRKTWLQPAGGVGAEALADWVVTVAAAATRPRVPTAATSARRSGLRLRWMPDVSLMWGASRGGVRRVSESALRGEHNVLPLTPVVKS